MALHPRHVPTIGLVLSAIQTKFQTLMSFRHSFFMWLLSLLHIAPLQEHAEIIASDRSCRWNQTPADQVTRSLCSLCMPLQHGLRRLKAQIWSIQKPPPADPHSGSGQTHTACTSACLGPQDFHKDWGLIRIHRIVMTVLKAGESLKSSSLLAAVPYLRHHLRQGSHWDKPCHVIIFHVEKVARDSPWQFHDSPTVPIVPIMFTFLFDPNVSFIHCALPPSSSKA